MTMMFHGMARYREQVMLDGWTPDSEGEGRAFSNKSFSVFPLSRSAAAKSIGLFNGRSENSPGYDLNLFFPLRF